MSQKCHKSFINLYKLYKLVMHLCYLGQFENSHENSQVPDEELEMESIMIVFKRCLSLLPGTNSFPYCACIMQVHWSRHCKLGMFIQSQCDFCTFWKPFCDMEKLTAKENTKIYLWMHNKKAVMLNGWFMSSCSTFLSLQCLQSSLPSPNCTIAGYAQRLLPLSFCVFLSKHQLYSIW